jgi:hypothetical protein
MTYPVFTATDNCYNLGVSNVSANLTMVTQSVTPSSVIKIDNAGPNVAYVKFGTGAVTVNHPTAGTGNSTQCIPVLPSSTVYVNPNLGTVTGNITVAAITAAGTATILITSGV